MKPLIAPPASRTPPAGRRASSSAHLPEDDQVVVCYPLAGDSLGGSHHSLLGLLRQLDASRFRPLVVVENLQSRLAEHFSEFEQVIDPAAPRVPFEAGTPFSPMKFASTLGGLRARTKFLKNHNVSIVHTNDGRSHATWALAAKLSGAKLVWHHRGDPSAKGLRYLAPMLADRIAAVSRFSLPEEKSWRGMRNAEVIFSPFETDVSADRATVHARITTELGLPPETVICGYSGLFISRKRPLMFIEAVARLQELTDGPVAGVMFGAAEDADMASAVRSHITRHRLEEVVFLMGYRSPGWEWLAGCDILMVPAVREPLGRTLVEAMLVETPVVATRSGGNPEALGDHLGMLVEPDDPDAMARGCVEILAEPQRTAAMVKRARADARERFADRRHVEAIVRLYGELSNTLRS